LKKLYLPFLLWFYTITAALGCCTAEPHTLTELLFHDDYHRVIFTGTVVFGGAKFGYGEYFAVVNVDEVTKGVISQNTVQIWTGGNTTAGGDLLEAGQKWIFFAHQSRATPTEYSACVCDHFSSQLSLDAHNRSIYLASRLQIVADFRRMTKTGYTGNVLWYYPDGIKAAEGQFKNGKAHGKWQHFTYAGTLSSEVNYQKGLKHGEEQRIRYNQQIEYRAYRNGEQVLDDFTSPNHGQHEPNTQKIDELYGIPLMRNQSRHRNGRVRYEGFFLTPKSNQREALKNMGIPHGPFVYYDTSGVVLQKGTYEMGAKTGAWIETDYNTSITHRKVYAMIPANTDKTFCAYHENGQKAIIGQMKKGKPEGAWQYFREDGTLQRTSEYLHGKRHGAEQQIRAGVTYEVTHYVSDLKHGEEILHHSNDTIQSRVSYRNGLPQGAATTWHSNGRINSQANYVNGKMEGNYLEINAKGDTILITQMLNDAIHGGAIETLFDLRGVCRRKQGSYEYGLKVDTWFVYDCDGNLLKKCEANASPEYRIRRTHLESLDGCD
jgi:antitoxin component YwqK of YwqJK toxin-antitoxin module